MHQITIDPNLCKRDGLCAMACTRAVIRQDGKNTIPEVTVPEMCFGCGHCVAICPQGAISHSAYPGDMVSAIRSDLVPEYEQVLELVRSRRSKRLFRSKAVEKETIEKVLDAARFAPSEHNVQDTEFVVIQDRSLIHEIAALTAEYYDGLAKRLRTPVGKMMFRLMIGSEATEAVLAMVPEMELVVKVFNEGTDYILRDPPVLVIAHSAGSGGFGSVSANLALQNLTLAAEALGLGSFYAGFVLRACQRDDSISRLISLPKTHSIHGALALGYPRLRYKKWPERQPARVTWLGES